VWCRLVQINKHVDVYEILYRRLKGTQEKDTPALRLWASFARLQKNGRRPPKPELLRELMKEATDSEKKTLAKYLPAPGDEERHQEEDAPAITSHSSKVHPFPHIVQEATEESEEEVQRFLPTAQEYHKADTPPAASETSLVEKQPEGSDNTGKEEAMGRTTGGKRKALHHDKEDKEMAKLRVECKKLKARLKECEEELKRKVSENSRLTGQLAKERARTEEELKKKVSENSRLTGQLAKERASIEERLKRSEEATNKAIEDTLEANRRAARIFDKIRNYPGFVESAFFEMLHKAETEVESEGPQPYRPHQLVLCTWQNFSWMQEEIHRQRERLLGGGGSTTAGAAAGGSGVASADDQEEVCGKDGIATERKRSGSSGSNDETPAKKVASSPRQVADTSALHD